jgi:uncharacterized protein (DUF302 family)
MVKISRFSYSDTIAKLSEAIRAGGGTVFATIDQAAAAEGVGMKLRPTTLIVFGNPKGGTPLMDAFPEFALELPLKLVVWDDNGTVSVGFARMSDAAKRYGVTGMDDRVAALDATLDKLTSLVG